MGNMKTRTKLETGGTSGHAIKNGAIPIIPGRMAVQDVCMVA